MGDVRVRVAPEYSAGPLWWDDGQVGPVDRGDLPISAGLADDLEAWQAEYDGTLDWDDPAASRFPSAAAESAWRERGHALVARLRSELGDHAVTAFRLPGQEGLGAA